MLTRVAVPSFGRCTWHARTHPVRKRAVSRSGEKDLPTDLHRSAQI